MRLRSLSAAVLVATDLAPADTAGLKPGVALALVRVGQEVGRAPLGTEPFGLVLFTAVHAVGQAPAQAFQLAL